MSCKSRIFRWDRLSRQDIVLILKSSKKSHKTDVKNYFSTINNRFYPFLNAPDAAGKSSESGQPTNKNI